MAPRSKAFHAHRWLCWVTAIGLLLVGIFNVAYSARIQLVEYSDVPLQVDERYFASCAARGHVSGPLVSGACHDNKGPLIFLLHYALQSPEKPYDFFRVKIAALGLLGVVALLSSVLAWRIAGWPAAVMCAGMVACTFGISSGLYALKTEILGAAFLMGALCLLPLGEGKQTWLRLFFVGVLIGFATLSKQTYVLTLLPVCAWLIWGHGAWTRWQLRSGVAQALVVLVGVGAALMTTILLFANYESSASLLSSLFLYPSVYGDVPVGSFLQRAVWRTADIFDVFGSYTPVLALFASACAMMFRPEEQPGRVVQWRLMQVLLWTTLALASVLWLAPNFFTYHTIPAWVLMSVSAAVAATMFLDTMNRPNPHSVYLTVALLAAFAVVTAGRGIIHSSNAKALGDELSEFRGHGPQYAYVLGMWPHFYTQANMIPASNVVFPWALPGIGRFWAFSPPKKDTELANILARTQQRNLEALYRDFALTPPRFIAVSDDIAKSAESTRITDVPAFDNYLQTHCKYLRDVKDDRERPVKIFTCVP